MQTVTEERAVSTARSDESAILDALVRMRDGDFSVRLPHDWTGTGGKIADAFNQIAIANEELSKELFRVATVVGREGNIQERVGIRQMGGSWTGMERALNALIEDLAWPTTVVTRTIGAVARGDLAQTMLLEVNGRHLQGEFLRAGKIVNTMIGQLGVFTSEATRVAREVETEGKLGGQAQVPEVSGVWKELTESVNQMAGDLTAQVRNIAEVTTAVARGDLTRKITVDVRGEMLELKNTVNTMVDQLNSFASEVTRVAREVGTEGKLGGQAEVRGVAGTWRDLTENVNLMAANLTSQVRNIAQVTTAVATGDLSKTITVDAKGEILELKETINTMVDQLNSFASVTRVARVERPLVCGGGHARGAVQIVSADDERHHGLERGAFAYVTKPVDTDELRRIFDRLDRYINKPLKSLLVIEDNEIERTALGELIGGADVDVRMATSGEEALQLLQEHTFDCVVVDLRLPGMSGFELLDEVGASPMFEDLPVVVFTGRDLTPEEETKLRRVARSIILKDVRSPERLLDATSLFLHRQTSRMPDDKQRLLEKLHTTDELLVDRQALVVDDDVRNIFALTSMLESHHMRVLSATNGREGIAMLESAPGVDVVLMDIMMPEMDGFETMRLMRANPQFKLLPIIALTAKAMKGDREKCLEAGASDYIAKPINKEQLLSLLRIWLHR